LDNPDCIVIDPVAEYIRYNITLKIFVTKYDHAFLLPNRTSQISPDMEMNPLQSASEPTIRITDLLFSYSGQLKEPVLKIPVWEVTAGQHVFLYGPSGSGKTTLLNLLGGFLVPQEGNIRELGRDMASLSARQRDRFRAHHIGMVFQQFNLIPYLSVMENVQLAAGFGRQTAATTSDRIMHLFARLQLDSRLLNRRSDNLSVGQQQRVAIARALINGPEILIADEPTSALDSDVRDSFIELLLECARLDRSTLVFVSHDRALQSYFSESIDLRELNQVRGYGYAA